jgi:hypothetical protein
MRSDSRPSYFAALLFSAYGCFEGERFRSLSLELKRRSASASISLHLRVFARRLR